VGQSGGIVEQADKFMRWFLPGISATAPRERIDILLLGSKELEEIEPLVFTGFCDGQEGQVLVDAFLGRRTSHYVPKPRKRFDGVFGIVVVPRHTVVAKKRKKFVAVFQEALLAFEGRFALEIRGA
jgi:hypothetical protein